MSLDMKKIFLFPLFEIGLVSFACCEELNFGCFVDPFDGMHMCKEIDLRCYDSDCVSSQMLSVVCVQTNSADQGCSEYLIFSGNKVLDWILNGHVKDKDYTSIDERNFPCAYGDFILTHDSGCFGDELKIKHKKDRSFVSLLEINNYKRRKMAEAIGGMYLPLLPDIIFGMKFREERFSYLDYDHFKDIGLYTGLYTSDEGKFCFVAIVKGLDNRIRDFLIERGAVQFCSKDCQIKTEKLFIKNSNAIKANCELVEDGDVRQLRFCIEMMGVRRGMQIMYSDSGWGKL